MMAAVSHRKSSHSRESRPFTFYPHPYSSKPTKSKKDLARFCVLHTAGLKILLLREDILPVLNIILLKMIGWDH